MAPMTLPFLTIGTPPMLGSASPRKTVGAAAQNGEPFSAISPSSFVERRKLAAATALACEVCGLKNPAPSPRITSTVRPASSTTEAVITVPSAFAFASAALAARSAISRVSSIMIFVPPYRSLLQRRRGSRQAELSVPGGLTRARGPAILAIRRRSPAGAARLVGTGEENSMTRSLSLTLAMWLSLTCVAAAQGPSPLPRTQTIVEEIRRLEGVRDPKCHATASRLEDLIYGTPLTSEARFRKNDLQKDLVLAIWGAASEKARQRGLAEIRRDVLDEARRVFLEYGTVAHGDGRV